MRKIVLRAVFVSALLTFALAGVALAHVEVSPGQVPAGATETFTVEVPTEKEVPTTEVRIELPEGFEATGAEAPAGWQGEVQGNALVWTGGEIPVAESEEFAFEATVPDEAGSFRLDAIQTYGDDSVVEWTGAADSEEPAPVVEVAAGGQTGGEADEPQHGDEHGDTHGSASASASASATATASATASASGSASPLPDSGGPGTAPLLAACAAALAAAVLALRYALR